MKKMLFTALLCATLASGAYASQAGIKAPSDNLTVSEAIELSAKLHASLNDNNITGGGYSYALSNGIISETSFDDTAREIKRHEFVSLINGCLPDGYLYDINDVEEIADVPYSNSYYEDVRAFYGAGILQGNDRFGTFMPDNSITVHESSAIIDRVSDSEKRVRSVITDGNYADGYYLLNESTAEFSTSTTFNDDSWNYDNRNRIAQISNAAYHVHDYYDDGSVTLWRDIEDVDCGLVGWDYYGNLRHIGNGLSFYLSDDEQNPVVKLEINDGTFYFCGENTGIEASMGTLYFKILCDLDKQTAELHINGVKADGIYKISDYTVSRVYIFSPEEEINAVDLSRCDIYKDFPVKEIFLMPENTDLTCWDVTGDAKVVTKGGQSYQDTRSAYMTAGSVAKRQFNELSGNVVFETYMLLPEDADEGYVELKSGDAVVARIDVNNYGVFAHDGTKLRHHTNNIWQTLRIEADTVNGYAKFRINGKDTGIIPLSGNTDCVDGIAVGCNAGSIYFDDVSVFMTHEYDDYCPEPVPINNTDNYNTLLNICSLWHEGSHYGWGCVSSFPDIEPALGYYDEGIPEVADWEIKFMVENGIDVQHLCWYCPSSNINQPIKRSNLNFALHDGYFNSKYSNMMKFMFMWENNGQNCSSLEQFKEYIWNYWVDYYFLDERYFTIENKIVFTVWNPSKFRAAFGGEQALIDEAIAFMNEDIKRYGFDGVIILFSDSTQSETSLTTHANTGADGVYAYHWTHDGNTAEKSIARMERNIDNETLSIVPTVSVGFNNLGWSGTRKDMISTYDHKQVLDFIVNDFLPERDGTWQKNTIIVSTWNEYGEGTYVMPCEGLNGFGYIENVAETVSGVYDHSNNIYPTDKQKSRLGHMYQTSETSLKKHDYEKKEYPEVPAKSLYSITGNDVTKLFGLTDISVTNGVYKAKSTGNDSGIVISADKRPSVDASNIKAIRIRLKANVSCASEIFFMSDKMTEYDADHRLEFKLTASDKFNDYIVYTDSYKSWSGNITGLRLDILTTVGTFEFAELELLDYTDEQRPYTLYADGVEYVPPFDPYEENGEVYIVASPINGFFSLCNYFHNWSRFTGELYILARNGTEVTFNIGSDTAYVNGEPKKLAKPVVLRDGLPVLPLKFLFDNTGMEYERDGKNFYAYALGKEYYKKIESRKPYEYEFEIPGDYEGFVAAGMISVVYGGRIKGEALIRPENTVQPYDSMLTLSDLEIDTTKCKKIVVGMKHTTPAASSMEIFFKTDTLTTWSQRQSAKSQLNGTHTDDFVEYTLDFSSNKLWNGTVTAVRVDPVSAQGTFEIDYIRFVFD